MRFDGPEGARFFGFSRESVWRRGKVLEYWELGRRPDALVKRRRITNIPSKLKRKVFGMPLLLILPLIRPHEG